MTSLRTHLPFHAIGPMLLLALLCACGARVTAPAGPPDSLSPPATPAFSMAQEALPDEASAGGDAPEEVDADSAAAPTGSPGMRATLTPTPAGPSRAPAMDEAAGAIPSASPQATVIAATATRAPVLGALQPTALPPGPTRVAAAAGRAAAASGLAIALVRTNYERWGRPGGMDGRGGCTGFNDKRPVQRVSVVLRVHNGSPRDVAAADWRVQMLRSDGKPAYLCLSGSASARRLDVPAGEARDMTFVAFVELHERITGIDLQARGVSPSNRLTLE